MVEFPKLKELRHCCALTYPQNARNSIFSKDLIFKDFMGEDGSPTSLQGLPWQSVSQTLTLKCNNWV